MFVLHTGTSANIVVFAEEKSNPQFRVCNTQMTSLVAAETEEHIHGMSL